jgi:hypothetical protein
MTIPTTSSLRRRQKRLDLRSASVRLVLARMRKGYTLHQTFERTGTAWTLSDGTKVEAATAAVVVRHVHVRSTRDDLLGIAKLAQTFRWQD